MHWVLATVNATSPLDLWHRPGLKVHQNFVTHSHYPIRYLWRPIGQIGLFPKCDKCTSVLRCSKQENRKSIRGRSSPPRFDAQKQKLPRRYDFHWCHKVLCIGGKNGLTVIVFYVSSQLYLFLIHCNCFCPNSRKPPLRFRLLLSQIWHSSAMYSISIELLIWQASCSDFFVWLGSAPRQTACAVNPFASASASGFNPVSVPKKQCL